ncbi:hypothetical protein [Roseivivax sediminis]|uniref:2TM domain-containing protein n=1 Tax=Roseivivax sediminis TaxID=936889 RepID=A0A1I2CPP4_9RHOB|nr:hypothetical protein [Roseivivax sediminis]SFE69730.1 hypothetical protein SAMN04515678_11414 [Roseivivax sediminis]
MRPKVRDERIKLFATLNNNVAIGFIGFALIRPVVSAEPVLWAYVAIGVGAHGVALYILRYLSEDKA